MPRSALPIVSWVNASVPGWKRAARTSRREPFELVAATERGSADDVAGEVDDAHRRGRRAPLGGEDVDRPRRTVVGALHPVGGETIELGPCCGELEVHLGDACLHERVMVHGAGRDRDRRRPLAVLDRELHRPFGDADVDVADQRERPDRHRPDRRVVLTGRRGRRRARRRRRRTPRRARVSWLSVARMPCASQVATTSTPAACRDTKPCTTTGPPGSVVSMAWNPMPIPHRAERSEQLATVDPPATRDPFGPGGRQGDRDVVARFAVSRGEHLAGRRPVEDPLAERMTEPGQIGAEADPVQVHARGQRRRRREPGQPALPGRHLGEVEAETAELDRRGRQQPTAGCAARRGRRAGRRPRRHVLRPARGIGRGAPLRGSPAAWSR